MPLGFMSYRIRINTGVQQGESAEVEGLTIVGRSPRCSLQVSDASVAWEHVALEDRSGRLFLSRLSAGEVRVNGQKLSGEQRLSSGDRIRLGADLEFLVVELLKTNRSGSRVALIAAIAIVLMMGAVGFAILQRGEGKVTQVKVGLDEWRKTYGKLESQLNRWAERGSYPDEAVAIFKDAWRYEMAGNVEEAYRRYALLDSLLLSTRNPVPELSDSLLAEVDSTAPKTLNRMLRSSGSASGADSDRFYADAYYWFVKTRVKNTAARLQ